MATLEHGLVRRPAALDLKFTRRAVCEKTARLGKTLAVNRAVHIVPVIGLVGAGATVVPLHASPDRYKVGFPKDFRYGTVEKPTGREIAEDMSRTIPQELPLVLEEDRYGGGFLQGEGQQIPSGEIIQLTIDPIQRDVPTRDVFIVTMNNLSRIVNVEAYPGAKPIRVLFQRPEIGGDDVDIQIVRHFTGRSPFTPAEIQAASSLSYITNNCPEKDIQQAAVTVLPQDRNVTNVGREASKRFLIVPYILNGKRAWLQVTIDNHEKGGRYWEWLLAMLDRTIDIEWTDLFYPDGEENEKAQGPDHGTLIITKEQKGQDGLLTLKTATTNHNFLPVDADLYKNAPQFGYAPEVVHPNHYEIGIYTQFQDSDQQWLSFEGLNDDGEISGGVSHPKIRRFAEIHPKFAGLDFYKAA